MFKATAGKFAKVNVGTPDLSKLSITQFASAGVLTNPGVSIFGGVLPTGVIRAGVSIGPPLAVPGVTLPFSLEVSGVAQYFGILNIFGAYLIYKYQVQNLLWISLLLGLFSYIYLKTFLLKTSRYTNGNNHFKGRNHLS